jgi:hypothetical protein
MKRQQPKWKPLVSITGPCRQARHKALADAIEAPLLALQAGENLPLPAPPDARSSSGR